MGVLSKAASYQMIIVKKGQISNLLGTMYIVFAEHRQKLDHIYNILLIFVVFLSQFLPLNQTGGDRCYVPVPSCTIFGCYVP